MYVESLQHRKIPQGMAKHPLRFGVWHRYKMVVLTVYDTYQPLWTAFECLGLLNYPNTVSVLCTPHVIVMERTVLAVSLATSRLGSSLRRSIVREAWHVRKSTAQCEHILCRLPTL